MAIEPKSPDIILDELKKEFVLAVMKGAITKTEVETFTRSSLASLLAYAEEQVKANNPAPRMAGSGELLYTDGISTGRWQAFQICLAVLREIREEITKEV